MTSRTVLAAGTPVHVCVEGSPDAPAVLLIHGFSGSLHWFHAVSTALATDHRVIRADLRGHGRTGGHTGLDPEAQAETLDAVLETLGIGDTTVAGHSFGADVALALSRRRSSVRAVAIIGQAPDYSYATLPPGGEIMTLPLLGPVLHRLSPAAAIRFGMRTGFAPGFRGVDTFDCPQRPVLDYRAMSSAMYRVVLTERRARLAADPLDSQVEALGLPTLVLHGDHDQMYDVGRTTARYAAAGARVDIITGTGHSPNIERPAEVARLLGAFAAEHGR